jgi:hypothetical protein
VAHSRHVEGVQAQHRLRAAARRHVGDPGRVRAEMGELAGAIVAEGVEGPLQVLLVTAGRGPYRPASVVIDHDSEVAVALLAGDLVHPDPAQPREPVHPGGLLGGDPCADSPDRAPGDPQHLPDRRPGGGDRQPRAGVLKAAGEPGTRPRPRHCRDDHVVLWAADPGRIGLKECLDHAKVQRPPATAALALIVAGAAASAPRAAPAAATGRPYTGNHSLGVLVVPHLLDDGVLDTQQPLP